MIHSHQNKKTWQKKIHRFIALSNFSKSKFIEAGFSSDKISVKPNFVQDPYQGAQFERPVNFNGHALYLGRLNQEKGILRLVRAWKKMNFPLHIAGSGPLLKQIENEQSENVTLLGHLDQAEKDEALRNARFLILPSESYEGFPVVVAEAYAHGLPILASRIGSLQELIVDQKTGVHFAVDDELDLQTKANTLFHSKELLSKMNSECRAHYETYFSAGVNFRSLMNIYRATLDNLVK